MESDISFYFLIRMDMPLSVHNPLCGIVFVSHDDMSEFILFPRHVTSYSHGVIKLMPCADQQHYDLAKEYRLGAELLLIPELNDTKNLFDLLNPKNVVL
jgi:hypothetical protein